MPMRRRDIRGARIQSAMEYLMTYGWAILIIAIVLGVLYYLGVFNPANFAPREQPGSCQVLRPNGPGTNFDVGLSGTCNNEPPEYVGKFNGASSTINVGNSNALEPSSFTISGWVRFNANSAWMMVDKGTVNVAGTYYIYGDYVSSGGGNEPDCTMFGPTGTRYDTFFGTLNTDTFYMLTCEFNASSGTIRTFVNGVLVSSHTGAALGQNTYNVIIGNYAGGGYFTNGDFGNIQLYNTSLSQPGINALYQEGIGGPPIDLSNLAGWWPLNGNANDYSGNLNNGAAAAVAYTNAWAFGYTAP